MFRVMPFGKYKGRPFNHVPVDYFEWMLRQDWLSGWLRQQIEDYLENGEDAEEESPPPPNGDPFKLRFTEGEQALLKSMLQAGRRVLALKLHPDQGGDGEAIKQLNLLVEKLRKGNLLE